MSHYILDKAYKITNPEGTCAWRIVVQGAKDGECKHPDSANAGEILGITMHSQSLQNQGVAIRKAGIARVAAAGPIRAGEPVNIAGNTGKVKAINEPAGTTINCLGFAETSAMADGDIVEVFISLHQRIA